MNGKIHGKQIRETSIGLSKLSLTGIESEDQGGFILATGSYLGSYEMTNDPLQYTNKQYVDSVASGLDPKESVVAVTEGIVDITLSGTQSIDGYLLSDGDRVLVVDQTNAIENGIYVVGTSSWVRATDSDGMPNNEVSLGNYTFVERGTTYSATGWVLYQSDAIGSTVSVGVDTQVWTQFNGAGSFIWGNGINNTGNNIFIDLDSNSGLTFSASRLKIDDSVAGNGLTIASGVINVGAGTGITVNTDDIAITNTGVTAGSYGDANSVSTFTVNAQGQLTFVDQIDINITSSQVSDFNTATETAIFSDANFVDGVTVQFDVTAGASTTAEVVNGSLTASKLNSTGGATAGYILSANTDGTFNWIANVGGITEVVAGSGLTGGGDNGSVTLNVVTGNGIEIVGGSVSVNLVNTDSGLEFVSSELQIDLASNSGLSLTGGLGVDSSIAGSALSLTSGVLDINVAKGVTFSGDALFADADTIVTTSQLTNINIATGSSIQSAFNAIDAKLTNVGAQSMICIENSVSGSFLKVINSPQDVLSGYTFSTASDGCPSIFINGAYVRPSSSTASVVYFSTDGGTNGTQTVEVGSILYTNPFVLNYSLDSNDTITVEYLTRLS